jgi:methylphosphotriester-DNA--protein-cysteine methyltransferase
MDGTPIEARSTARSPRQCGIYGNVRARWKVNAFLWKLLVDGNLAVTRISKEIGYASVSHFISEFRGRFGVTPRAYCDAHALRGELDSQREH